MKYKHGYKLKRRKSLDKSVAQSDVSMAREAEKRNEIARNIVSEACPKRKS